jgi:hypothetical protein
MSRRGRPSVLNGVRLLLERLVAECSGDRQTDCRDDCEEPYAGRCSKTGGPEHKQDTRVANFRLVEERIAFDDHECDNRNP